MAPPGPRRGLARPHRGGPGQMGNAGWKFSPAGDAQIGVALTAAAVPAWMQLSLMEECRGRVEQALAVLATIAEPDARQEMKLLAALGASRLYTRGGVPEVASAWTRALELAESLG